MFFGVFKVEVPLVQRDFDFEPSPTALETIGRGSTTTTRTLSGDFTVFLVLVHKRISFSTDMCMLHALV
jgi:hypothetical protein